MLKKTLKYTVIVLGMFAMFTSISCKNDDDIASEIVIYYQDRTQDVEDDVTSTTIRFTAYTNWYVTIDTLYSDWLSAEAYSGSTGSFTLTCNMEMNDDEESRKGIIVFHGDNQTSQATITQRGYQIVTFKDAQFEQYCIENFDLDESGYVTSREAHLAEEIDCPDKGIADMTGIEHFKNIEKIDVSGNNLYTLSLTKSHELTSIRCQNCPTLSGLELGAYMHELTYLNCSNCNLTSINIDSCTMLKEMNIKANDLRSLNITNNEYLTILDISENYNMTSLFVNEDQTLTRLTKEESTVIVYPSDIVTVPDAEFQKYLLQQFDVNRDNQIDAGEAEAVKYIRCNGEEGNVRPIYSLEGMEYFPNIITLDCSYCMIDKLDLDYNPKLTTISCHSNSNLNSIKISALSPLTKFFCTHCPLLTSLDLNKNSHLFELYADSCNLSSIDFTGCTSLVHIHVSHNRLTTLETPDCGGLLFLDCSYNDLQGTLSIKDRDSLAYIFCSHNRIESLDLDPDDLYDIDCGNNEISGEVNLAEWKYLHTFACDSNSITSLKLPGNEFMTMLDARSNNLTELDLSKHPTVQYVYADYNNMSAINTTGCDYLERLTLRANSFSGTASFSANRGLKILWLDQNPDLTTLYIPKGLEQFEYIVDDGVEVIER